MKFIISILIVLVGMSQINARSASNSIFSSLHAADKRRAKQIAKITSDRQKQKKHQPSKRMQKKALQKN